MKFTLLSVLLVFSYISNGQEQNTTPSQIKTIRNAANLTEEIIKYDLNGEEHTKIFYTYYPSDTLKEVFIDRKDIKTYHKYDEMGGMIESKLWKNNIIKNYEIYQNNYDSLDRKISTHEFDSAHVFIKALNFYYEENNRLVRVEELNSSLNITEYHKYYYKFDGLDIEQSSETFSANGQLLEAQKKIKISPDFPPADCHLFYSYNNLGILDHFELTRIGRKEDFVPIFLDVYFNCKDGVLTSMSVEEFRVTYLELQNPNELNAHPLVKEYHLVNNKNAANKLLPIHQ